MLIVEGPDGVGKTTLCKKLLAKLPQHIYAHFTRLPSEFDYFWGYVDRMSQFVVQDRFHLSEIVYARARGEQSKLTPELYRLVDAKLRLLGGMTILVTADPALVESRWDESQMYDREKTVKAARVFEGMHSYFPKYTIDVDHHIICSKERPFPTDGDADRVLSDYMSRLGLINYTLMRKWYHAGL